MSALYLFLLVCLSNRLLVRLKYTCIMYTYMYMYLSVCKRERESVCVYVFACACACVRDKLNSGADTAEAKVVRHCEHQRRLDRL